MEELENIDKYQNDLDNCDLKKLIPDIQAVGNRIKKISSDSFKKFFELEQVETFFVEYIEKCISDEE
jgi:hypothetical protein